MPRGILITVRYDGVLSELILRARDLNNTVDTVNRSVEGRSLLDDPLVVQIEPTDTLGDRFLLHIKGVRDGQVVAASSQILSFSNESVVESDFLLRDGFVDRDDDGFEDCTGNGCDCLDTSAAVNPFTFEICGDGIDNNCSGWPPDEGCSCSVGSEPLPCSQLTGTDLTTKAGVGRCAFGQLPCIDGTRAAGCDDLLPIEEIANNGEDDDCDGSVDEGSSCTAGATRECHRGFIDTAARQLAVGVCTTGTQTCGSDNTWGPCEGDILPQRAPDGVGWLEAPEQCDGRDNDCDGLFDEEPYFDTDGDGYTFCGSRVSSPVHTEAGVADHFIDCDDGNANIAPSAAELCGNTVDEDCVCNHTPGAPPTYSVTLDPFSLIRNCPDVQPNGDALLDCARAERDIYPNGVCGEASQPYYFGYVPDEVTGDCYFCADVYGLSCNPDGSCSSPVEDCLACSAQGDRAVTRPVCRQPAPGFCENSIGITLDDWAMVAAGEDPGNDCGQFACASTSPRYYFGILPNPTMSASGICYFMEDVVAAFCDGQGACRTRDAVCSSGNQGNPDVSRPLCQRAVGGCDGITPPTYGLVVAGTDPFGDCPTTSCDGVGSCYLPQGASCSLGGTCAPGLTCEDGVCCSSNCGACETCNAAGNCVAVDQADDDECGGYCCTGNCVQLGSGFATSCGSMGCVGTWACNGGAAQCSSSGIECDACAGDTIDERACDDSGVCASTGSTECAACFTCAINSGSGNCGQPYGVNTEDTTGTNTCELASFDSCNGSGDCLKINGEVCSGPSDCISGFCVPGNNGNMVCCDQGSCGTCEDCKERGTSDPGTVGTCVAISGDDTDDDLCPLCCDGTCNNVSGAVFGQACAGTAADCGGTWACSGTTAECSSSGNTCYRCEAGAPYTGTCSNDGTLCTGGSPGSACTICTQCDDSGSGPATCGNAPALSTQMGVCDATNGVCGGMGVQGCACDGTGMCLRAPGNDCTMPSDCASMSCTMGACD